MELTQSELLNDILDIIIELYITNLLYQQIPVDSTNTHFMRLTGSLYTKLDLFTAL